MIVLTCLESPRVGDAAKAAEALSRRLAGVAQTVAVCAGGKASGEVLDWALGRRSFARVLHLQDGGLDNAGFMTLGMVLAEVARHVQANLVVAGEHSDIEGQGLVPAALAHQWNVPLVARVLSVRMSTTDPGRTELTLAAAGYRTTVDCPLPLVVTTAGPPAEDAETDAPSPASAVEVLTLAQLALDPSRLVPRPELLGTQVAAPAARQLSPDEAARFLLHGP